MMAARMMCNSTVLSLPPLKLKATPEALQTIACITNKKRSTDITRTMRPCVCSVRRLLVYMRKGSK